MRILHVTMLYPPHVMGGAERSVCMLAEAQAAAGHQVAVACTTPGPFAEEWRNGVAVFRMPHESLFWAEDWPRHNGLARVWRKALMPFNAGMRGHFSRVLDQFRPDIINSHSMVDVTTSLWPAATAQGYCVVHTLRDYDLLCVDGAMYHGGKGCGAKCKILSRPKQWHHRHISGVVAISHEVLQQHLDHGCFTALPPERRRIIWNSARASGTSAAYQRPDRGAQPFTFGFLGRISAEKGIGTLIDAARQLPAGRPWQIRVAGTSPAGIDSFIQASQGLPIHFAGQMDPLAFFETIDILVVPSIWAEPFGRVIIEAYSAGVPVLAARTGGIPGLIAGDKDRWLVPPGDAGALAQRMNAILDAGRAALPAAEEFAPILEQTTPETIARQYSQFYQTVLDHRQNSGAA